MPSQLSPPSVENTKWAWELEGDAQVITFLPGGHALFERRNSTWSARGKWELASGRLRFDCNNFTLYDVAVHARHMDGHWRRSDGSTSGMTALTQIDESFSMHDPFSLTVSQLSPIIQEEVRDTPLLADTVWTNARGASAPVVHFHANGAVSYQRAPHITEPRRVPLVGSWTLDGDVAHFTLGDGDIYMTLIVGDRMIGERFAEGSLADRHHAAFTRSTPTDSWHNDRLANEPAAAALVNTRWVWPGSDEKSVIFGPGGELYTHHKSAGRDERPTNNLATSLGRWHVSGDRVTFDTSLFTMFVCTRYDGTLRGEWHRVPDPSHSHPSTILHQVEPIDLANMSFAPVQKNLNGRRA